MQSHTGDGDISFDPNDILVDSESAEGFKEWLQFRRAAIILGRDIAYQKQMHAGKEIDVKGAIDYTQKHCEVIATPALYDAYTL